MRLTLIRHELHESSVSFAFLLARSPLVAENAIRLSYHVCYINYIEYLPWTWR